MVACSDDALRKEAVQAPRLIVEVLSPSTSRLDRQEKARNYRQLVSLEEYVLVAQDRHEVVIQRRTEEWAALRLSGADAIAEFRSIGLSLSLASIYEGAL
jgi:Uma2 family endonuclease